MRPSVWHRRRGFPPAAMLVLFVALIAAAGLATAWFRAPPEALVGRAVAIDGDTLRLASSRIRLVGLDAPELDQTCADTEGRDWACGRAAKEFLAGLVGTGPVRCLRTGRDIYGRILARCSVDGRDVGAELVRSGWAVMDFAYASEETEARSLKAGLWSGSFVSPIEWRRSHGTDRAGPWEWIRSWFQ